MRETQEGYLLGGSDTPVAVERPGALLALLAAVFGAPAAATLGELARELLPLAALIVGALSDAAARVVLAAEVPHNNPGPVLHVGTVVADGELLHKGEDVQVVGEQIFLVKRVVVVDRRVQVDILAIEKVKLLANLKTRNKVALLEVRSQVAILGDVRQELK